MRILISGAGIAGMTLAALLRQRGLVPDVIERATSFDHAGYALGLYPLGNRVLHGLNLFPPFAARSPALDRYCVHAGNGKPLRSFAFAPLNERHGAVRMIARGELLQMLAEACSGVEVRRATTISDLRENPQAVRVRTSDGREGDYDLVVAADGIHSDLRRLISPQHQVFDTGWACFAWWIHPDAGFAHDEIVEQWARSRFIGLYPTADRLNVVAAAPARVLGFGTSDSRPRRLHEAFGHLRGPAEQALARLPEDSRDLFYWKLDDQRAQVWTRGRLALLGDAACAFLPTAGIGASMAMESAAVLADELSRCDAARLPRALAFYEQRRRARSEAAQNDSRKLAKWMSVRNPLVIFARNQAVRRMALASFAKDIFALLERPI